MFVYQLYPSQKTYYMPYKQLPDVQDEMFDWEHNEVVEGKIIEIEDFTSKNGKQVIIYNIQMNNGEMARFFDTFTLHTIYKHCVPGDRIKITRTAIVPSRDGQRNFYTFKVERDEPEDVLIDIEIPAVAKEIDAKDIPW